MGRVKGNIPSPYHRKNWLSLASLLLQRRKLHRYYTGYFSLKLRIIHIEWYWRHIIQNKNIVLSNSETIGKQVPKIESNMSCIGIHYFLSSFGSYIYHLLIHSLLFFLQEVINFFALCGQMRLFSCFFLATYFEHLT